MEMNRVQGFDPLPGNIGAPGNPIPTHPDHVVHLVGNLRLIVLIFHSAVIFIQHS